MQNRLIKVAFVAAVLLMPAACGRNAGGAPNLITIESSGSGPDEFAILPGKPLQSPEDYSSLPAPTPGGSNLTDPTPLSDAVAALGGRASTLQQDGAAGPDGGLLAHASRFGISANIREVAAAEDLEFRRNNKARLLERLFNVTVYYEKYASQSLDRYAELLRMRRLGIRTPAAPPEGTAQ